MADRYKVYEQLGAGGVGTVFRAYDSQLKRWVAIKRLTLDSEARDSGADIQEELRQEADSLATLRNPNIVTIFDVASDEDGLFIVMEMLEGEDLADVVARGPLPYDDFKELAYQTLEGLLAAHQHHILHRDIKPENIKVERLPGGRMQAKIIDFGLARVGLKARKQTEDVSGTVLGSIHYMAPEQLTREPVDERTDLYSLGCVFYEALSGQKAFDGPSMSDVIDKHINHEVTPLHAIAPHVPPWLGSWVERLMAPRPEDRPLNAQQAMEEFRAWERMPSMVPYMPWMVMPDPNAYAEVQPVMPVEEEPIAVAVLDDDPPVIRRASAPVQPRRPGNPPSSHAHAGSHSGRLSQTGQLHAGGSQPKSKSKLPLILGGLALVGAAVAYFIFKGGDQTSSDSSPSQSGSTSTSQPKFDLPVDRLMPPLDEDRSVHFVADVGTLQSGRSSDGKPFPAYANDSVVDWRDLAPRGADNALQPWQGKAAFAPKRIAWPTSANGPSVKGNRAALQFKSAPSAPIALEGTFKKAAKAFPFGGDSVKGAQGMSVAVVFQNTEDARAGTLLQLRGEGTDALSLLLTADKKLQVLGSSSSGRVQLESQNIDVSQPTIAVVTWETSTGKLHLLALNPPKETKGKLALFQGSSSTSAAPPSTPLTYLQIGSGEPAQAQQFHGVLGELILYASALSDEQRRLLGSTQLKSYYFKL
jgi:serine/threonine protein kinase